MLCGGGSSIKIWFLFKKKYKMKMEHARAEHGEGGAGKRFCKNHANLFPRFPLSDDVVTY
jgi:hypothetical protein